jgi:uncharacterized protein YndB with AHSA1/START domain
VTSTRTIERDLPAEPGRVWNALTDARELTRWFWPPRLEAAIEADARVGGRYRIASPSAGMAVSGEYRNVESPTRVVFTWSWDGEAEQTLVTIDLAEAGDGTHLTLVHEGFAKPETRDEHAQGWQDCLERLPAHVSALPEYR